MAGTDHSIPTTLGKYRVLRRLGAGGMAEVFLAKSTGAEGIEKILVVKRILPTFARSAKFLAMFKGEAEVAVRLNHPNIVQVYAFEQVRDELLLAMEFVDGLDLGRVVSAARRKGLRIPHGIAAYVVMEMAKGLDYAHNRKDEHGQPMEIVHRDVSPQNVLFSYEGTVKVADFGIAKARMVSEETGVIKGKFGYMSPEQARGQRVDRRSDVYSLGILLAELLMGRTMYPGQHGLDVLEQVREGRITLPRTVDPDVPVALEQIVARATAFDPEERYQTARSLAGAIGQFLHGLEDLYDAERLERFISQVAPREVTSPDVHTAGPRPEDTSSTAATVASAAAVGPAGEHRERRQVVVVAGRVRAATGSMPGSQPGSQPEVEKSVAGIGEEAVRVLEDMAFKADAVLSWADGPERRRFQFIVGLGSASVQDPLTAIRLGMDVVEALQGLSADRLVPLEASIGVSRGVVSTLRDPTGRLLKSEPIGSVVEVAQQLARAAEAGEILCAGEVYRLVRRTFAFDESAVREVEVATGHGSVPRAVRAWKLRGGRTREEQQADAVGAADRLVGRSDELRAIEEAHQDSIASRRAVFVAIVGELGVGKSALASAALEGLDPRPRILRAECGFGTSDVPFAAAAEIIREAVGIDSDASRDRARDKLREFAAKALDDVDERETLLAGLEPLVAPVARDPDAESDRSRMIWRGVELLFQILSAQGPTVVFIDSLQWADLPSLELLRALLQRSYELPVMALLATRPDPRIEPVLSGVPRIELGGLHEDAARDLVRARFEGASVPGDVETAIVERAGGNPFFLIELIDALLERGVIAIESDGTDRRVVRRPGVPIALPTTLEGIIAARLGELPEEQRRALRWLAVAGPGLRAEDLSQIAGTDLAASLQALETRGLVQRRPAGAYAFPSAVVRHVAYESTDPDDRIWMHRRLAAHLSGRGGDVPPARIARHLEHAGEREAAASAYLQAAEAARSVYSNREALRFYGRALGLLPADDPSRFYAHEAREQILRGMARRREQIMELEAMRAYAEATGDAAMRALAYNRLARYHLDVYSTAGVDALLRQALDAAIDARSRGAEVEALRLSMQLAREQGDTAKALEAGDRALARAGFDRELLAARGSVLIQRSALLRRLGRLDEALEASVESVVLFRRLGIKRNEAHALNSLGVVLALSGGLEDAIAMIRASIALDREIGDRYHLGIKLSNLGQLYGELGDTDRALEFLGRAIDVFDATDDHSGRSDALTAMAEQLLENRADVEAAALRLDDARRMAERTGVHEDVARERIVRVALDKAMGHIDRAERSANEAIVAAHAGGLVVLELEAQACLAEMLARHERLDEAKDLARRVRERVRTQNNLRTERILLACARALIAAGEPDEGARARAEAAQIVERRLEQLRTPALRERYLATPTVRAVRDAAPL